MEHAGGRLRVEPRALRFSFRARSLFVLPQSAAAISKAGPAPLCIPDDHTLCLEHDRFAVTVLLRCTPIGASVQATAVPVTDRHRLLLVLRSRNVELSRRS